MTFQKRTFDIATDSPAGSYFTAHDGHQIYYNVWKVRWSKHTLLSRNGPHTFVHYQHEQKAH